VVRLLKKFVALYDEITSGTPVNENWVKKYCKQIWQRKSSVRKQLANDLCCRSSLQIRYVIIAIKYVML